MQQSKGISAKIVDTFIPLVAIGMVIYHLVNVYYALNTPIAFQNMHLMFALVVMFLLALKGKPKLWPLYAIFIILSLLATGYVQVLLGALEERAGIPTTMDTVIGFMLVLVSIIGTWQAFGPVLPMVAILFMLYNFLGHYLPAPFYHISLSAGKIATHSSIGLTGMYGAPLSASAMFVFLFVVFGSLFEVTGVTEVFIQVAGWIGAKVRGGSAFLAVFSSGCVGMVTGQAASNVVITGVMTIPMMKKSGMKAEEAGAVEAVASSGGQIMPPVMGAAAFLMASYLMVPYVEVVKVAFLPAFLFYFCIAAYVLLLGAKKKLSPPPRPEMSKREIFSRVLLFLVPFTLIIVLLLEGFSPMRAGFWAIISILILSIVRKQTRPSLSQLIGSLVKGAKTGSEIGVVCACLGPVMGSMTMTGLGPKLGSLVGIWGEGMFIPALLIMMAVTVLLGCGLPTLAAYMIVAMISAPVLAKFGIDSFVVHFTVLYWAVFSGLTPPVAVAALVASKVANASYMKTCLEALKMGWIGLILLPYMFIFFPEILGVGKGSMLLAFVACLLGVNSVTVAMVGYLFTSLSLPMRSLFLLSGAWFLGLRLLVLQGWSGVIAGVLFLGLISALCRYFQRIQCVSKPG